MTERDPISLLKCLHAFLSFFDIAPFPDRTYNSNRMQSFFFFFNTQLKLTRTNLSIWQGFGAEVQLDDTAKLLNTERRRIYDIVNVFEAVQIMSKVMKKRNI